MGDLPSPPEYLAAPLPPLGPTILLRLVAQGFVPKCNNFPGYVCQPCAIPARRCEYGLRCKPISQGQLSYKLEALAAAALSAYSSILSGRWHDVRQNVSCNKRADGRLTTDSVVRYNKPIRSVTHCSVLAPSMGSTQRAVGMPVSDEIGDGDCINSGNGGQKTISVDGRHGDLGKSTVHETTTPVSRENSIPTNPATSMSADTTTNMPTASHTERLRYPHSMTAAQKRHGGSLALKILGDWVWEIWFCIVSVASFISEFASSPASSYVPRLRTVYGPDVSLPN